jgi:formylglycine-generating enzyme
VPVLHLVHIPHGLLACLAVAPALTGCSDPRITLGWNATDTGVQPVPDASVDAQPGDDGGPDAGDIDGEADDTDAEAGNFDAEASTMDAEAGGFDAEAGTAAASCGVSGAGLTDCGPDAESCCASLEVPAGTFYRTYKNAAGVLTGEADPATVTGFRLDKYLVTVGRFRQFVAAWNGGMGWVPQAGSGKHTHLNGGKGLSVTGGGYEPGWATPDNGTIAPTNANLECTGALVANLTPGSTYGTWTPSPGAQENLPITCETWYDAYAFCIWDGGFLPSEAELGYAAAGGSAQLQYPWGTTDPGTGNGYAIYGCWFPSASGTCTGVANFAPVGTTVHGAGLWGQLDLAGTVWEWTLDFYGNYVTPCGDCTDLTVSASGRVARGGDFNRGTTDFPPTRHPDPPADTGAYAYGIRCARVP